MRLRLFTRPCAHCKKLFFGKRVLKYCGEDCRKLVAKAQNADYERRVKRPAHLYRKKKLAATEFQFELALDSVREVPYKEAS